MTMLWRPEGVGACKGVATSVVLGIRSLPVAVLKVVLAGP
jgi:hypothetical protein